MVCDRHHHLIIKLSTYHGVSVLTYAWCTLALLTVIEALSTLWKSREIKRRKEKEKEMNSALY